MNAACASSTPGRSVKRMIESLSDTAQTLKVYQEIITKAELRWLCAAAVHATSGQGPA